MTRPAMLEKLRPCGTRQVGHSFWNVAWWAAMAITEPDIRQRADGCVVVDFFGDGKGPYFILTAEQWRGLWRAMNKLSV